MAFLPAFESLLTGYLEFVILEDLEPRLEEVLGQDTDEGVDLVREDTLSSLCLHVNNPHDDFEELFIVQLPVPLIPRPIIALLIDRVCSDEGRR
jgi:hypothetical protein